MIYIPYEIIIYILSDYRYGYLVNKEVKSKYRCTDGLYLLANRYSLNLGPVSGFINYGRRCLTLSDYSYMLSLSYHTNRAWINAMTRSSSSNIFDRVMSCDAISSESSTIHDMPMIDYEVTNIDVEYEYVSISYTLFRKLPSRMLDNILHEDMFSIKSLCDGEELLIRKDYYIINSSVTGNDIALTSSDVVKMFSERGLTLWQYTY